MKYKAWIPLAIFVVLIAFLALGLKLNPREVPSPLIGKTAPVFSAPRLHAPDKTMTNVDMLGKVWMLNVWASWCAACRVEHPVLMAFSKTNTLPIIGLDYKDKVADGMKWLAQHGDPYEASVTDPDGRIGINFGVYGVPETFIIDKAGIIRHKHIGPVTEAALQDTILPLIRRLQK